MGEITTEAEFERWLDGQSAQVQYVIGSRAALRVFPAVLGAMVDPKVENDAIGQLALLTARAIVTSAVAGTMPTADVEISVALSAANSSARSAARSTALNSANSTALNSANSSARFAANSAANSAADSSAHFAAYFDADLVGGNLGDSGVFETGIWDGAQIPEGIANQWKSFQRSDIGNVPEWAFWREWYQGFLDGKPMDWAIQRRVALIPDADWEKGAAHIAGEIAEIRARLDLENRIGELETALVEATQSRHGIGGNFPPEPVSNVAPVARELLVIWEPLQELKTEVGAKNPNKTKISKGIEAIGLALKAGLKWCASKADLAVDTAIKWAVPALGGGYLAMNPDKISAVVDAAKLWLAMLP